MMKFGAEGGALQQEFGDVPTLLLEAQGVVDQLELLVLSLEDEGVVNWISFAASAPSKKRGDLQSVDDGVYEDAAG